MKTCIIEGCTNECEKGYRYCREHYLIRKRAYAKERYMKFGRHSYDCICIVCGKNFHGSEKYTKFCSRECMTKYNRIDSDYTTTKYIAHVKTPIAEHRYIIEQLLNRKLKYNEVIHHLDGTKTNNSLDNLIIVSRSNHRKLHAFLTNKKFDLMKQFGNNIDDYWNNIKAKISEEWFKTENKNYIKASEIENQTKIEEILNFL